MTEWNDARPLLTGPGRALAVMIADEMNRHAFMMVTGCLEGLSTQTEPRPQATAQETEIALSCYLAGVAAAAMVADAARGTREWTGAGDFTAGGEEVEFLAPETVLLGTLTLALTAVGRGLELAGAWAAQPGVTVPAGHRETLKLIQQSLAQSAQARMTQVSERAEDVAGA